VGPHRWQRSVAIALFLSAWAILSWPWLSGAVTIPYDAKALFQAELQFLANAIHQGQSPFWSPNVFGGSPQIADPQSLIFSPMVLLALLAPHPTFHALDVAVLALLAVAGIAVLMYFRDRGWHPAGGVVAALAVRVRRLGGRGASSTSDRSRASFSSQSRSACSQRALECSSVFYGLAAGVAGALMLMEPDQVAFLAALFLVGVVLDHWLRQPSWRAALIRSLKPLSAATLAGLLIIAVPILLTALFAESSDRAAYSYAEATRGSLHPASLLTMLVGGLFSPAYEVPYWGPYSLAWDPRRLFLSPNMSQLYAGALPMLAILVVGIGRGIAWTREIRFYAIALVVLIVYALGSFTPLYRVVFELLPGVSAFRRPADATFLIGGAVAILGGYLVHRVASGTMPPLRRCHQTVAVALVTAFFVAALTVAVGAGHVTTRLRRLRALSAGPSRPRSCCC
jgi:hypothetical protein